MAKLRKANRILEIKDDFVNGYLQRGYDQINEKGEVVRQATGGRNVSAAEYNKVFEANKRLQAEITKLKSENTKLKKSE